MAYSPNPKALSVTNFLLQINTWEYTTGGTTIINTIKTAATNQTAVTNAEYESYTRYTAWRYKTYVQHNDLSQ